MHIVIVGAGINGVTAALELKQRGHEVTLIDPGPLPHPGAASTDISKAVRSAYGEDEVYTELAERSIERWRKWNSEFFDEPFYHEVGFLFARRKAMVAGDFEHESWDLLRRRGHQLERIDRAQLRKRYPAWAAERYEDGFFDPVSGYAESGRVVAALLKRAEADGVNSRARNQFRALDEADNRVKGIVLADGEKIEGERVLFATGAWTPYLLPFTRRFFRATGHPVFHLQPRDPTLFLPERFPVFGADICTTGYYGFPIGREGVVKIANHGPGREMPPDSPGRAVTEEETNELRAFVAETFPALVDASIVYTRICLYCDTADGDFWIAPDPDRAGLILTTGDSGHGFKFAPVLGEITADVVEGQDNPLIEKFRWRPEVPWGVKKEAARALNREM